MFESGDFSTGMLILVLVLVLKDSLRTFFKSFVLVLVLGGQVLVLVLVLGGQVLVLVLVLGGQVLVNIPGFYRTERNSEKIERA